MIIRRTTVDKDHVAKNRLFFASNKCSNSSLSAAPDGLPDFEAAFIRKVRKHNEPLIFQRIQSSTQLLKLPHLTLASKSDN